AVSMDSNTLVNPGPPTLGAGPSALSVTCPANIVQLGIPYNSILVATGGTPPRTFSITGSLPAGLSLNTSSGAVTGVPFLGGTSSFSANTQDAASGTATRSCSIFTIPP